jgi:hypothetical protein
VTKKPAREILKSTPTSARYLADVVAGDSAELLDGEIVLVAWQWDEVTMVSRATDGPRGGPRRMPSNTLIAAVKRKERANLADGKTVDPLMGG